MIKVRKLFFKSTNANENNPFDGISVLQSHLCLIIQGLNCRQSNYLSKLLENKQKKNRNGTDCIEERQLIPECNIQDGRHWRTINERESMHPLLSKDGEKVKKETAMLTQPLCFPFPPFQLKSKTLFQNMMVNVSK